MHCGYQMSLSHYDVIKWKHFPRNWPFVRRIHRKPRDSGLDFFNRSEICQAPRQQRLLWHTISRLRDLTRFADTPYTNRSIAVHGPDIKDMEPIWGSSGAGRTQVGPMLAPWTLLSGDPSELWRLRRTENGTYNFRRNWQCPPNILSWNN